MELPAARMAHQPLEISPEKLALVLFSVTFFQASFLFPYFTVVPGERANLFTALLCAISLVAAIRMAIGRNQKLPAREVWFSVVLIGLVIASGLTSSTRRLSMYRGFTIIAPALGGFWCSRLLITTPERRATLVKASCWTLAGLILFSVLGYRLRGEFHLFLDVNRHPLFTRILILTGAPLALAQRESAGQRLLAAALLWASYFVLYISELRSAIAIPIVLSILALGLRQLEWSDFKILAMAAALATACFIFLHPNRQFQLSAAFEPAFYRLENYPFSWHVALKNPWLGNGARAPRTVYLKDYQLWTPGLSPERFSDSVKRIVTSDNIFLTFLADFGFPFVILYSTALIGLMARLVKLLRHPVMPEPILAASLFFPLCGAIIHFAMYDGLYFPQVCWFFHILLGLIPTRDNEPS